MNYYEITRRREYSENWILNYKYLKIRLVNNKYLVILIDNKYNIENLELTYKKSDIDNQILDGRLKKLNKIDKLKLLLKIKHI